MMFKERMKEFKIIKKHLKKIVDLADDPDLNSVYKGLTYCIKQTELDIKSYLLMGQTLQKYKIKRG